MPKLVLAISDPLSHRAESTIPFLPCPCPPFSSSSLAPISYTSLRLISDIDRKYKVSIPIRLTLFRESFSPKVPSVGVPLGERVSPQGRGLREIFPPSFFSLFYSLRTREKQKQAGVSTPRYAVVVA